MQMMLHSRSRIVLHPHDFLLVNPIETNTLSPRTMLATKSPYFNSSLPLLHQTHIQKVVICARKNRRRPASQRSMRSMLKWMSFFASHLKVLPQPLDLVISEFGGGDGGGIGFWRGFGGGGGFDWWRRKGKRTLGVWGYLGVCGLCFLFGRESNKDIRWAILGFALMGAGLVKECQRGFNWVLGFCCFGALVTLGLRREHLMKWIEETRVWSSTVDRVRRSNRKGRRRL